MSVSESQTVKTSVATLDDTDLSIEEQAAADSAELIAVREQLDAQQKDADDFALLQRAIISEKIGDVVRLNPLNSEDAQKLYNVFLNHAGGNIASMYCIAFQKTDGGDSAGGFFDLCTSDALLSDWIESNSRMHVYEESGLGAKLKEYYNTQVHITKTCAKVDSAVNVSTEDTLAAATTQHPHLDQNPIDDTTAVVVIPLAKLSELIGTQLAEQLIDTKQKRFFRWIEDHRLLDHMVYVDAEIL